LFAVIVVGGGSVGAFWSKDGHTGASWALFSLRWGVRRLRGPVLSGEPLEGAISGTQARGRENSAPATFAPGIELMELPAQPGHSAVGVAVDRNSRHWVCALPVRGAAFSLLDPEDQASRLDSWRVVLNALGRPGTPLRRVQWIERSGPAEAITPDQQAAAGPPLESRYRSALDSYREVVAAAGTGSHFHATWLVVAVEGPDSFSGNAGRRAAETIRREVRLIEGQLRNAGLSTPGPLDRAALAGVLQGTYRTGSLSRDAPAWRRFRPMADEEGWSAFRTDETWHVTYWIAEWPRIAVGPDFMSAMLMNGGQRAVSLVMAPVPPDRSARDVRSARTADAAEEHLRANAGFTPNARRGRELEAAVRREEELADGHSEFRFSGYITVSAGDRAELDIACAETEHAAQAAHLEIRRLYGRQREAFTWTLPLARGLR
jgi:hypothetical protein